MVQLFRTDLQFILDQIILAETGQDPPTPFHPWGLRTVSGFRNHIIPGQETWGAADQDFLRLLTPVFRSAGLVTIDPDGPGRGQAVGQQTSYLQTSGFVFDASLRLISNLIVDQTPNNPAAVDANGGAPVVVSPGLDGLFGTGDERDVFLIPNIAPDEGLSAPFNSWFTFFGQFFDHGLDLVNKGGSGTVFIPLAPDDPLFNPDADGPDNIPGTADDAANFMMLTRATNDPGPDGVLGTVDDIRQHNNQTTPFVDQNQTYTSHPSHQVFLRQYAPNASGDAVSTGNLLDGSHGGLATWADVKAQAASMLGILLNDHDVLNVPLLLTDAFGRFIPGANGFVQVGVRTGNGADGRAGTADDAIVYVEGVAGGLDINSPAAITAALVAAGSAITTGTVVRIDHAFLDDIAHAAAPGTFDHDGNPATPRVNDIADGDAIVGTTLVLNVNYDPTYRNANPTRAETLLLEVTQFVAVNPLFNAALPVSVNNRQFLNPSWVYDNELLNAHFSTGDGRGNENIGLTAVHTIFHAEHNRLVQAIKDEVLAINDPLFTANWVLAGANIADGVQEGEWNGERLFQAARVFTEMQYQHLVFEEFARKIQPSIDVFINIDMSINPAIFAEFAHVVYRFGHSMLTETIDRLDANFNVVGDGNPTEPGNQQIGLIGAFLNPLEFVASGVDAAAATAAIVRGMTRQSGNAIDEFVTEALRNNLVGLPLDLPVLNLARGRDTGIPGLNEARRQLYAATGDAKLIPYTSWIDFAQNVKHPASVINFIAAYGTHALITGESTVEGRRAAAMAIVTGVDQLVENGTRTIAAPTDAVAFLNATGAYAGGSLGGLEGVDLWIGGLAELPPAFGGMLGSTFAFVFETQMENLQNGDRFYYLARFSGLNFLAELEGNSFATLIMRNTDLRHLPGDVFSTPTWTLEVDQSQQFTGLGPSNNADPTYADEGEPNNPFFPLVSRNDPATPGPDGNFLRYGGGGHVVLGGTDQADTLIAGIGDDTVWGDGGNDRIEGGNGFDILNGGDGDDIITDLGFDDNIKGNDGNDVIHAGEGLDLVIGGRGSDFINLGAGSGEAFAGLGNDFVTADGTLFGLVGGFGDDWLESGFGIGGLTGDNADVDGAALNFGNNDPAGGHDVLIGGGAPNDFDSFGGDDIMVSGMGTDRLEGFIGFDWVTYQNNTAFGAVADMLVLVFGQPPLPGDPGATLDRFDLVEGLSGSGLADILRGDNRQNGDPGLGLELSMVGHEMNAAGIARITGMANFLGEAAAGADNTVGTLDDMFASGNIIMGGGGSDIMEGRGGDDIIDGDAFMNVAIGVYDALGNLLERATTMDQLQARMLSGVLNPGQLGIIREVLYSASQDFDTAMFTGNRADYFIEGQDTVEGISDQNGDGFIQVQHLARDAAGAIIPGAIGIDGTDLLRNVERAQFNDVSVNIATTPNLGPVGVPTIDDTTPAEDQTLTASAAGVTDPNNTFTGGAITGLISITWQELIGGTGLWTDILIDNGTNGGEGPVPATGFTFTVTQAQAGALIRVRMNYIDQNDVLETVYSAATASVTATNDAPVGALVISDPSPTEGDLLTALVAFSDADGLTGAVYAFQWESSADGVTWTPIAGATTATFSPTAAEIGLRLHAVVTYTDDAGFDETVTSAATDIVGDVILGTAGNDTGATALNGTVGADRIFGLGGNDTLNGLGGGDVLDGAAGTDTLNGGDGNDTLLGGTGVDTLNGGADNDTLNGGTSNDTVNGEGGDDTFVYAFGDGADNMDGGAGIDTLNVTGTNGANTLDVVYNGALVSVEGGSVVSIERVNADLRLGIDTLTYAGTAAAFALTVNLATGFATGFTSIAGIENVTGGSGNDTLIGDAGSNVLNGGANGGADTLVGGLGHDNMLGGGGDDTFFATVPGAGLTDGDDTINGGTGVDIYSLGSTSADAVINLATGTATSAQIGTDTLVGIEGVVGSAGLDTITGTGGTNILAGAGGADTINAGGGADTVMGGDGNDTINGGTGVDIIFGDAGDDILTGGTGNDRFVFAAGFGNDIITDFDENPGGGQDLLDVAGLGVTAANFNAMVVRAQVGADVVITINGQTITLQGETLANITAADFIVGP